MRVFLLVVTAIIAYFLGGLNGAIISSKYIFHRDIRDYGSGNAGLTNYFRTFGAAGVVLVILVDAVKSVIAILVGGLLLGTQGYPMVGRLFAGFCLIMGHMFPAIYQFRGGKGVMCIGILAWMVDWRVGLVCWAAFALVVIFTRYVSLGSMIGSLFLPILIWAFGFGTLEGVLGLLCALLVVVKHAENIVRLIGGTERKLEFKSGGSMGGGKQ